MRFMITLVIHIDLLMLLYSRLFEVIKDEGCEHPEATYRYVDGIKGIKVECADVSCVFEFVAYRFKGEDLYMPKAKTILCTPKLARIPQHNTPNNDQAVENGVAPHADSQAPNDGQSVCGSTHRADHEAEVTHSNQLQEDNSLGSSGSTYHSPKSTPDIARRNDSEITPAPAIVNSNNQEIGCLEETEGGLGTVKVADGIAMKRSSKGSSSVQCSLYQHTQV